MTDTNPIEAGIPGVEVVAWRCEDLILPNVSIIDDWEHAQARLRQPTAWTVEPLVRKSDYDALAEQNAALVEERDALTYKSKQSTMCPCGEVRHTPLRRDHMGGYVCLTCIDKELDRLLAERDTLTSRLQEAEKALEDGWQPIETAGYAGALVTARNRHGAFREPISAFKDATDVWRILGSRGGMTQVSFNPTHWRPLPTPPAALANKGESDAG